MGCRLSARDEPLPYELYRQGTSPCPTNLIYCLSRNFITPPPLLNLIFPFSFSEIFLTISTADFKLLQMKVILSTDYNALLVTFFQFF